jgi:hypothetical protein
MSSAESLNNADAIRDTWLVRLGHLVDSVDSWAKELGWSTRRIEKPMKDSRLGSYKAPGLIMQEEFIRIILDPLGHSSPGTEGVVDLYLMPAFDDIASLFFYDGAWHLHYGNSEDKTIATITEEVSRPLTKETFAEVLDELKKHAA